MLRHHDITHDVAAIPACGLAPVLLETVFAATRIEQPHAVIATKRDEVQAALVLIADWFDVHSWKL